MELGMFTECAVGNLRLTETGTVFHTGIEVGFIREVDGSIEAFDTQLKELGREDESEATFSTVQEALDWFGL